ncbi:hypothetical protein CHS0354_009643 [Potamilus streckersoni]|uniref:Metalloprotease TIKI homolog n=1 Tax=Potamilus streckersoni TaxID=2493646 RepID=A0AAE0VQ02_9BIVA|nr:hypothetical protein CHS0354_009643 [Potamilus streckersoni]
MMYSSFMLFTLLTFMIIVDQTDSRGRHEECEDEKTGELNSFLWKLNRDPPSYFFGTIHVPYTRVWDYIPDNSKIAFEQSEHIFFELDLTDPYTMVALARCQLLPHGENLSNVLPRDIYRRLKQHLDYVKVMMPLWLTVDQKGKGMYADYLFNAIAGNWERKRPIWVMLMVNSLTETDIKSRGIPVLDLYLAQEADKMGKITGAIERVEEQCVPLNELNFSQVLFALNQTLWQHEVLRTSKGRSVYTTDDLIHHYNCGDLNSIIFDHDSAQLPLLSNSSIQPQDLETAKVIDDYFRIELINKRNRRMADRVISLLKTHPKKSFFFAFGAGHFLGNDTVLDRLKGEGFGVDHLSPDAHIPEVKLQKRYKNGRKNRLQEEFGDFWFQMDAESRAWLEQTHKVKKKKYRSNKPFNDLWVRLETPRPSLMQQIADTDLHGPVEWTTPNFISFIQHGYTSNGASYCFFVTASWEIIPLYLMQLVLVFVIVG